MRNLQPVCRHGNVALPWRIALDVARTTRDRAASVIEGVRPLIQADGGDIELIGVDDAGVVRVRLLGACVGCPAAAMTLAFGVERRLKQEIPEVTRVVCV